MKREHRQVSCSDEVRTRWSRTCTRRRSFRSTFPSQRRGRGWWCRRENSQPRGNGRRCTAQRPVGFRQEEKLGERIHHRNSDKALVRKRQSRQYQCDHFKASHDRERFGSGTAIMLRLGNSRHSKPRTLRRTLSRRSMNMQNVQPLPLLPQVSRSSTWYTIIRSHRLR